MAGLLQPRRTWNKDLDNILRWLMLAKRGQESEVRNARACFYLFKLSDPGAPSYPNKTSPIEGFRYRLHDSIGGRTRLTNGTDRHDKLVCPTDRDSWPLKKP